MLFRSELIGAMPTRAGDSRGRFEGYTSKEATEKKVLRDVFRDGDAFFRTGDLLRQDAKGYFYFVDRIGDTFRWKGENVATNQVSEVVTTFDGIQEANVYGVSVPGADGRAGMAAIVCKGAPDMAALYRHVTTNLPAYARPMFLRLQDRMDTTGTFKHRKVDLVKDGFDPSQVKAPLFLLDDESAAYVRLDQAMYKRVQAGQVRI